MGDEHGKRERILKITRTLGRWDTSERYTRPEFSSGMEIFSTESRHTFGRIAL
jgi:hypothetical protein